MTVKRTTIKSRPSDCAAEVSSGTFTLVFREYRRGGDITIKLTFEFWWIAHIANTLRLVIQRMRRNLNDAVRNEITENRTPLDMDQPDETGAQ